MKKPYFHIKTGKKKSEKDKCVTEKLKISVDATEIDTVSEKLTLPATVLDETAEKANRLVELLLYCCFYVLSGLIALPYRYRRSRTNPFGRYINPLA